MFGIGETELALILIFAFLIFGPDKLPGMGRTIGRMLRQFREAQEGFTEVVQTEVMDPLNNAMNEPQTEDEKKRSSARAAAMDEDADIESGADGAAPRRETFAERRERLARERAAAEQEAATDTDSAGEKDADSDSDVDSDADVDAPQAAAGEKVEEPSSESAAPVRSVASLYAMKGTRKATPVARPADEDADSDADSDADASVDSDADVDADSDADATPVAKGGED